MGLNINGVGSTQSTQQILAKAATNLKRTQAQQASGLQINGAADDAAGLQTANAFETQIRQYTQEANNLQAGVSLAQTADGALASQQEAVGRLRELAVQASSGTLGSDQRTALNQEAQNLLVQINGTAQNTEFNGTKLLDGSTGAIALGTQGGETMSINASTTDALGLNALDLSSQAGASAALGQLDNASSVIQQNRAGLGAQQNRLTVGIDMLDTSAQNLQSSQSLIRDTDYANAAIQQTQSQMQLMQTTFAQAQGNITAQTVGKLLGV